MKKILFAMLALVMSIGASADSIKFYVPNETVEPGQQATLSLCMTNDCNVGSFTIELKLPEGLIFTETRAARVFAKTERMPEGTSTTAAFQGGSNQHIKVVFYDSYGIDGDGIEAGDGAVYTFKVTVAEDAKPGDYSVEVVSAMGCDLSGDISYNDVITLANGTITIAEPAPTTATVQAIAGENGTVSITPAAEGNVYEIGSEITISATPNAGYEFAGWSNGETTNPLKVTVECDTTFTATFAVKSYNVVFVVDNKKDTISVAYGTTIEMPANPEKEGYTFKGWDKVTPESMPAEDLTFTAVWEVNTYKVSYYNGEELLKEYEVAYGEPIPGYTWESEDDRYTFVGWDKDIPESMPAAELTFTAIWEAKTYKVSYYNGEELLKEFEVAYGDPIPEYTWESEDERYTFIGWNGETYDSMPAHDVKYVLNFADTIYGISLPEATGQIYTVDGRIVNTGKSNLRAGIYIINGKKYIVK